MPERILLADTTVDGIALTAVSYHAPPGVSWGIVKPRQAVTVARWLAAQQGPILLGADANTPLIDAADFAATRTHWHTGDRHLHGEPRDDLLFGPSKIHSLQDALRCWLADHPREAAALAGRPAGPLAITSRTGPREDSPGTGRRYDSIWLTQHWTTQRIDHLYDEGIAAGSDHAAIVVDLTVTQQQSDTQATTGLTPRQAHCPPLPNPPGQHPASDASTSCLSDTAEEFIPGRYCRDCGWPFPATRNGTHCRAPGACKRRQALPLHLREYGCPRNGRVHPEWRDQHLLPPNPGDLSRTSAPASGIVVTKLWRMAKARAGRPANGRTDWKIDGSGISFGDWQDQGIDQVAGERSK